MIWTKNHMLNLDMVKVKVPAYLTQANEDSATVFKLQQK